VMRGEKLHVPHGFDFPADAVIVNGTNGNESLCGRRGVRRFRILIGGPGQDALAGGSRHRDPMIRREGGRGRERCSRSHPAGRDEEVGRLAAHPGQRMGFVGLLDLGA